MVFKLKGKENQSTSLNSLESMLKHKLQHLREFHQRLEFLNTTIKEFKSYLYKKKHKPNARVLLDILKELQAEKMEIEAKIVELRQLKGEPDDREAIEQGDVQADTDTSLI